jgi:hypothetical protein
MDTFENKPTEPVGSANADVAALKTECAQLRRLLVSALVLMIVVSGTLNLYLLRQVKYARTDLAGLTQPVNQMRAEYEKARPVMEQFITRVQEFARTNPDFAPILTKYNLKPAGVPAAAPTSKVTAPAPAPAAPKK